MRPLCRLYPTGDAAREQGSEHCCCTLYGRHARSPRWCWRAWRGKAFKVVSGEEVGGNGGSSGSNMRAEPFRVIPHVFGKRMCARMCGKSTRHSRINQPLSGRGQGEGKEHFYQVRHCSPTAECFTTPAGRVWCKRRGHVCRCVGWTGCSNRTVAFLLRRTVVQLVRRGTT